MLQEGGDVGKMEVMVKRWSKSTNEQSKGGRWITKKQLMDDHGYTEILDITCKLKTIGYW